MLIKRCWFDLRSRFLWAVLLSLCFSAHFINVCSIAIKYNDAKINISYGPNLFMSEDMFNGLLEFCTLIVEDHTFFVDIVWFSLGLFFFEVSAIALALGGILGQKKSAFHMTLSLPVKRSHWLLAHGGITAFLMFLLIFGFTIFALTVSSFITGKYYPMDAALLNALFNWLACLPFIGISLLANSFFHNGYKSMMSIFIVAIIACWLRLPLFLLSYPFLFPLLKKPHDFTLPDLIIIILTTSVTTGLAVWRFNKNDY